MSCHHCDDLIAIGERLGRLDDKLSLILTLLKGSPMAQSDIDNAVAAMNDASAELGTDETAIAAQLAAGGDDTSALPPAVAQLQTAVAGISSLVVPAPAPGTAAAGSVPAQKAPGNPF